MGKSHTLLLNFTAAVVPVALTNGKRTDEPTEQQQNPQPKWRHSILHSTCRAKKIIGLRIENEWDTGNSGNEAPIIHRFDGFVLRIHEYPNDPNDLSFLQSGNTIKNCCFTC